MANASDSFKLTSPANDCSLEAQCIGFLYRFLIGVSKKLGPCFKDSWSVYGQCLDLKDFSEVHGVVECDTTMEDESLS